MRAAMRVEHQSRSQTRCAFIIDLAVEVHTVLSGLLEIFFFFFLNNANNAHYITRAFPKLPVFFLSNKRNVSCQLKCLH